MLVKFCIVLPILLLIQAVAGTEHEISQVRDEIEMQLNIVKQQLSPSPDVITTRGDQRRLMTPNMYSKISGFYQYEAYYDSNNKQTCSTENSEPKVAAGVAYGCVEYPAMASYGVASYGMTCDEPSAGSLTLGAKLFKGAGCTGGEATISGLSPSTLDVNFECDSSTGSIYYSCQGPILPASEYTGYRTTTFLDSCICMGQVFSYANFYIDSVVCDDGYVKTSGGTNLSKASCTCVNGMSTSTGCITKSSTPTKREFLKWDMKQVLNGIDLSTWNSRSFRNKNVVAVITSLAEIYGIDYNSFTSIIVTAGSTSTSTDRRLASGSVNIDYTIMVQPGFGNSYTKDNVYSEIETKHKAKVSSGCTTTGCFAPVLDRVATGMSVTDLNGVTAGTFNGASAPVATNGIEGDGDDVTPTSKKSTDSGIGAGGIVAILLALCVVGAAAYYKLVILPKQEASLMAANPARDEAPPAPAAPAAPAVPTTVNPMQTA